MPTRVCRVSFTDAGGVRPTVEVAAESLFEAAALGLAEMRREAWIDNPARGATLEIAVVAPVVKHTVTVQQVERWLDGVTTSPGELLKKQKLKAFLR
jgi:hypothetical protein